MLRAIKTSIFCSIFAVAIGCTGTARASFVTMVGNDVAFCSTSTICYYPPFTCGFAIEDLVEDLQTTFGDCSASFSDVGFYDLWSDSWSSGFWEAHGVTAYISNGDIATDSTIDATGERVSDQQFAVSGTYDLDYVHFLNDLGYADSGSAEIAVIRFSADPAELVGLLPTGVQDLVSAGLIAPSDILYLKNDFTDFPNPSMAFDFEVDVTGIPNDEIFVFATAQGEVPEPAQWTMLAAGIACLTGLHQRCESMLRPGRSPSA